jgi:hypothetical protein
VLKERLFPEEVQECQNNINYKTRQRKLNGVTKIQAENFNKCGRESFRKNTYKQTYSSRLPQQPSEP